MTLQEAVDRLVEWRFFLTSERRPNYMEKFLVDVRTSMMDVPEELEHEVALVQEASDNEFASAIGSKIAEWQNKP